MWEAALRAEEMAYCGSALIFSRPNGSRNSRASFENSSTMGNRCSCCEAMDSHGITPDSEEVPCHGALCLLSQDEDCSSATFKAAGAIKA